MSTNVNTVTNHYPSPQNGFTTTTSGSVGSGAATVGLNSIAGYTNGQIIVLVIDPTDASKKQTFTGVVDTAGVQVTGVKWTAGTNQTHALGATVVDYATATHISMITKGLLSAGLTQAGGMGAITPTSITSSGTITAANFVQTGGADSSGWTVGFGAPDTVAANGNRSYTLTYNATDKTSVVSAGMRLRTTRTVSAPTQCTSLNGTTQYYSKASPTGIAFTTTFTCSAWIKVSSYGVGGIINRRNADTEGWSFFLDANGAVNMNGLRIAGNNKAITSYQSVPLNKWVHVAATIDMAAADTTAQKIWIDGVEVPRSYTLTGTATALVQGTTALVVGALKSDGTSPFKGKIAQAAVFSTQLADATVKAMANQTMTGSETGLVSAYTFNNSINDLSANANNLTANGAAVATNADSPFGGQASGLISATLDYGIIQSVTFSTNTTLVVQVPEGCTIPTSGGVSAVSYSTQKAPYGFPAQEAKWEIWHGYKSQQTQSSPTNSQWYNLGSVQINMPVGEWRASYKMNLTGNKTGNGPATVHMSLSTANNTEGLVNFHTMVYLVVLSAVSHTFIGNQTTDDTLSVSAQATYYINAMSDNSMNSIEYRNDLSGMAWVKAKNAYL